jgi:hypothetical protein
MGIPKKTPSQSAAEGFRKAAAGNARRKREHLPRHTDAFLGQEEGTALLLGVWVPCRSRWVIAAKYEAEAEELWIRFGKDGVVEAEGYYPGVGFATAESFASASSKGGWLHDEGFVKGRSFIKV